MDQLWFLVTLAIGQTDDLLGGCEVELIANSCTLKISME